MNSLTASITLFELPSNAGLYDNGVQLGFQSLLVPSKKYRIQLYAEFTTYNDNNFKYALGFLPTIDSTIFQNFYFWKNVSGVNSTATSFPMFTQVGGIGLSSPPVLEWVNLN